MLTFEVIHHETPRLPFNSLHSASSTRIWLPLPPPAHASPPPLPSRQCVSSFFHRPSPPLPGATTQKSHFLNKKKEKAEKAASILPIRTPAPCPPVRGCPSQIGTHRAHSFAPIHTMSRIFPFLPFSSFVPAPSANSASGCPNGKPFLGHGWHEPSFPTRKHALPQVLLMRPRQLIICLSPNETKFTHTCASQRIQNVIDKGSPILSDLCNLHLYLCHISSTPGPLVSLPPLGRWWGIARSDCLPSPLSACTSTS